MDEFNVRQSIENLSGYTVQHVEAKIIADTNESNYPMPEEVKKKILAMTEAFPFHRYPPIKAENLSETIAKELDLPNDNVRIGNGAGELLQKACYAFGGSGKKIAFPVPSYDMYATYVQLSDSEAAPYRLTEDGYLDAEAVINFCNSEQVALLIICNPNNPTGNYNPLPQVERIIASVKCPVVVDEACMEFAGGRDVDSLDMRPLNKIWLVAGSVLTISGKYSNLLCIRTFSKAYGLAGLRCGYAVGCSGIIRILGKTLLPYQVNAYTLMAAKLVYENKLLYRELIKKVVQERQLLVDFLQQQGFEVWPSAANFVLFRANGRMAEILAESHDEVYGRDEKMTVLEKSGHFIYRYLLSHGILTADLAACPQLSGSIRLTVVLPEENEIIRQQLQLLCADVYMHGNKTREE